MQDVLDALDHDGTTLRAEDVTIDAIADTRPDLLIVDLRLGDASVLTDGWAVVVGSRAHAQLRDVPIVVCSADVVFLRERAAEIAALADVHPLSKPFSVTDLQELIDRLLSREPLEAPPAGVVASPASREPEVTQP